MIGAGKLDRRIALQRANTSVDSHTNESVQTWATYATVYAQKLHHKETEDSADGKRFAGYELYFVIRWRSGVQAQHRVVFEGETFEIEGEPRELGRRQYLKFRVRAVT